MISDRVLNKLSNNYYILPKTFKVPKCIEKGRHKWNESHILEEINHYNPQPEKCSKCSLIKICVYDEDRDEQTSIRPFRYVKQK